MAIISISRGSMSVGEAQAKCLGLELPLGLVGAAPG
jgi:hypothetical protein